MPTSTQHSHSNEQQMDAVVIEASGPPAQSLAYRREPVPEPGPGEVLVEVHAAAVNPLDVANVAGLLGTPLPMIPGVDFAGVVPVSEIYSRQLHVTGLASVFMDGAAAARIFDQLRPLFDRGFLTPPAVSTWPLEKAAEAYQTVLDGSAGIKQVLLPS